MVGIADDAHIPGVIRSRRFGIRHGWFLAQLARQRGAVNAGGSHDRPVRLIRRTITSLGVHRILSDDAVDDILTVSGGGNGRPFGQ